MEALAEHSCLGKNCRGCGCRSARSSGPPREDRHGQLLQGSHRSSSRGSAGLEPAMPTCLHSASGASNEDPGQPEGTVSRGNSWYIFRVKGCLVLLFTGFDYSFCLYMNEDKMQVEDA